MRSRHLYQQSFAEGKCELDEKGGKKGGNELWAAIFLDKKKTDLIKEGSQALSLRQTGGQKVGKEKTWLNSEGTVQVERGRT